MWRKLASSLLSVLAVLVLGGAITILAQDAEVTGEPLPAEFAAPTDVPTATPLPTSTLLPTTAPLSVSGINPAQFVQGVGGTLTISGANFSASTSVALNGTLPLTLTAQSADTLTAIVGADVAVGGYSVVVSDPVGGTQTAGAALTVLAPTSTATPLPTSTPSATPTTVIAAANATSAAITVTYTEPAQITAGQSATLSILGANFSTSTTVRLVGFGFLATTFVNSSALTAALPASIPVGAYLIKVADPTSGTASAPGTLAVVAATATPTAVIASTLTPTATTIPGQPRLVVNTFSASPASIYPGGTTLFTIQVLNVGSRTAEGVVLSLGDTKFAPANGQGSVYLPDLPSMTAYGALLAVMAPADASEGPQTIPITLTSRDFSGQTYSNDASVSVTVLATTTGAAQVVLDSYSVEPSTALPGEAVTVRALFKNTGTAAAAQVLVALDGSNGSLIAGPDGSSFAIGDLAAGASVPVTMRLVVASDANAGVQAQTLAISYLDDGEAAQSSASISLDVAAVTESSPLLLLQAYDTGQTEALQPGQQFTFTLTLQNAGAVDVSDLLVTFGTVSTSNSNATQTSPSTTTTTVSSDFAIYGSGGTVLLGELAAGASVSLAQDFIVSSDLTSGIQDLPITLRYQDSAGTDLQQSLSASLLVVVPPRLRISTTSTLDDPLTAGESVSLALTIANLGDSQVTLTEMRVTGENVEITEGAAVELDPLQSDDDTSQTAAFTPQAEGAYSVTVAVDYIDDLNRSQTITKTFSGQAEAARQMQFQPRGAPPEQQTTEDTTTRLGRLLLGFLGFGG